MNNNVIFREVQKFRQPWLRLILISQFLIVTGIFVYRIIQQLQKNSSLWDDPIIMLGITLILPTGLIIFFILTKLITEVRNDGIYIRFSPFHWSKISLEDLEECRIRTYNAIREYGGWRMSWNLIKGVKRYNASYNRGVALELSNGKRLLIGSQKPDKLAQAIEVALERAKKD